MFWMRGGGGVTNGVDCLVDHDFGKLEFLVLFVIDVLSDHGRRFVVRAHAISSTIHYTPVLIVCI